MGGGVAREARLSPESPESEKENLPLRHRDTKSSPWSERDDTDREKQGQNGPCQNHRFFLKYTSVAAVVTAIRPME